MIPLPQYLDRDAWEGFQAMRKATKKPLTLRAATLILKELQRIKDAGHDPNAALDQSTNHCWADVYVPKEKPIEPAARSAADDTARYLAEQSKPRQVTVDVPAMLAEAKARIRRVA